MEQAHEETNPAPKKRRSKPVPRVSVADVCAQMGVSPTVNQSWTIGAKVAMSWRRANDERAPKKELRPKRGGGGTQCHATYPANWRKRIEKIVRSICDPDPRQPDLFDMLG
jgi:hypothetical protein